MIYKKQILKLPVVVIGTAVAALGMEGTREPNTIWFKQANL